MRFLADDKGYQIFNKPVYCHYIDVNALGQTIFYLFANNRRFDFESTHIGFGSDMGFKEAKKMPDKQLNDIYLDFELYSYTMHGVALLKITYKRFRFKVYILLLTCGLPP